jgi:hypothetical protein
MIWVNASLTMIERRLRMMVPPAVNASGRGSRTRETRHAQIAAARSFNLYLIRGPRYCVLHLGEHGALLGVHHNVRHHLASDR